MPRERTDGMTYCGVFWGSHGCRFEDNGHTVGVDCECDCRDDPPFNDDPASPPVSHFPYYGPDTEFFDNSLCGAPAVADEANANFRAKLTTP